MKRKLAALVLSLLVICCVRSPVLADGDYQGYPTVNLNINGTTVHPDVPAIIVSGRTLVPLRVISESLNAQVAYDGNKNIVTVNTAGSKATDDDISPISGTYLGFQQVGIVVNGKELTSDVPPIIISDRTMVPIRVVSEALGASVDFQNNTVIITSDLLDPGLFQEDSTPVDQLSSDTSDANQTDVNDLVNNIDNDSSIVNDLNN